MSDTPEENAVLVERRDRVMIITMNRPEARNAINSALANGVWDAVQELNNDPGLTAGVLTGSAGTFCAGMDLKAFARGEEMGAMGSFIRGGCEKPLIAAIEGYALAGGCEMALSCDLLVAAKDSQIGIREVKVGLFAAGGGLFRLPSRVGYAKAMEMAITGDALNGQEAFEAGMVSQVTESGGAIDAAIALAERVAKNAPLAVAASKKLVRAAAQGVDEDTLWKMQEPFTEKVFKSNDAVEGPKAFAEKRDPNWSGT